MLTDRYPYSSETLNRTPSIHVTLPAASSIAAAGSRKTIEWRSTGCTYVDLYYQSGGTGLQSIEAGYPDVGVYQWTVPASAPAAADYTIYLDCKNSAGGSLGANGSSAPFTVAQAGLELLSPQGNNKIQEGAPAIVAWSRNPGVTGAVKVMYRSSPSSVPVMLADNITQNEVSVNVPAGGSPNASFTVQLSSNNAVQDGSDGFVNVTSTTPGMSGPSGTVGTGTLQLVQWNSRPDSAFVDLEHCSSSNVCQPLITNLPDFGRFYALMPDQAVNGGHIRLTFKSTAQATLATVDSAAFNTAVLATSGGGSVTSPAPPVPSSVNPSSGTGRSQTFTVTYTDPNGGSDITFAHIIINPSISVGNSCYLFYERSTNTFHLLTDTGDDQIPIMPGSGSLSNSKCTLNGAGAGTTISGNNMIVTFPITFPQSASGSRNLYGFAKDSTGNQSSFVTLGTWTVGNGPVTSPDVLGLTPSGGSGSSSTFTAVFRHPEGQSGHYLAYMLFLPLPNIVSFNAQGTCLIEYNRLGGNFDGKGGMRLIDNPGTGWLGRLVGEPVAPGTPPLSNNACTVNVAGTVVTFSGTDMVITVPVSFNLVGVTQVMGTFIQSNDVHGYWTDFRQFGTGRAGRRNKTRSLCSGSVLDHRSGFVGPVDGDGGPHLRNESDRPGARAAECPGNRGRDPCHAVYFPLDNTVTPVNDAGTGILPPVPLGTPLNTGRCSMAAGGTRSQSGITVTVNCP